MAVTNPPLALQNAGNTHPAELLRNGLSGILTGARANSSMVPRGGVHPAIGTGMAVTQQGSPTMGVTVGTGMCYVAGTEGTSQGAYACYAPTTTNVTITAAHASLPRIDLIVATVRDTAYSGANNDWLLQVVTGTAAASPSAPAAPNNSLILAQVAVGAAVTSIVNANITDKRPFIGMGIIPVAVFADLPSVGLYDGMMAYVRGEDTLYTYDGSAWTRDYRRGVPTGYVAGTTSTGSIGTTETTWTTIPSATYKANTAYELKMEATYVPSTTNFPVVAIRKTDVSGAILLDLACMPVVGQGSVTVAMQSSRIFTIGGSDVTTALVGTVRTLSGTVVIAAAAGRPRVIRIQEHGRAADFPNSPVLS